MSKVICICGKICSGKTVYAKKIKEKENAILLSTDEVTYALIDNEQGEFYNQFCIRVNDFLMKKSVELINIGCSVILDWGFWNKKERKKVTEFYHSHHIDVEWHYIDITEEDWEKNIKERNKKIEDGKDDFSFYMDEGLKKKIIENWEAPKKDEIDVWYTFKRNGKKI